MKRKYLVLCDKEEEYTNLMTEFISNHKELPWNILSYTDSDKLLNGEQQRDIALLLVSESTYTEQLKELKAKRIVILSESGRKNEEGYPHIFKYQPAAGVLKELLEVYMEIGEEQEKAVFIPQRKARIIGIYSPVRRCLQTTFALTLAQMLSEKAPTLYMNFEHYAGMTEILPDVQTRDLADLLYFLNLNQENFNLRMQTIIQHKGCLDYIPPMKAGQNLLTVTGAEWLLLLKKLEETSEYQYIILDLSECVQGLFDLLRACCRIFTLTKDDRVARAKLLQYEQMLQLYAYEDVLQKTNMLTTPFIRRLPEEMELYTKGEMADFVRTQLKQVIS